MDESIGKALREARKQKGLSLTDAEEATKIRVKYLRALESGDVEEVLPDAYTRGFLRSYAEYLGIDADPLVATYERQRRASEPPAAPSRPSRPAVGRLPSPRPTGPGWKILGLAAILIVALLAVVGIVTGDDDGPEPVATPEIEAPDPNGAAQEREERAARERARERELREEREAARESRLMILATAPVWVCLEDGGGETLVDGETLATDDELGPFEAEELRLTLGNGEARVEVDGEPLPIEPSPVPLGFAVSPAGFEALDADERPTCA